MKPQVSSFQPCVVFKHQTERCGEGVITDVSVSVSIRSSALCASLLHWEGHLSCLEELCVCVTVRVLLCQISDKRSVFNTSCSKWPQQLWTISASFTQSQRHEEKQREGGTLEENISVLMIPSESRTPPQLYLDS